MYESERHEMRLEATHPSGAEEWFCPTCGRRFLMSWPPDYQKVILDPGDEYAMHSGGKGDEYMHLGSLQMSAPDTMATALDSLPSPISHVDEAVEHDDSPLSHELRPWLRALEGLDLDTQ